MTSTISSRTTWTVDQPLREQIQLSLQGKMQQKTETKRSTHSLHTNNTMKPTLMVDKHFQNTHGNSDTWISKSILNTHTKRTRIDGSIQTRPRPRRRPAVDAAVRDQGNGNSIRCSQSWRRRERWMRCLPTFPRDAPGWYTRSRVVRNFVMDIHACARATDGVDPFVHSFRDGRPTDEI